MVLSTARITETGQISIPPDMAEKLQLVPGAEIDIMLMHTGILLKPKSPKP
jgi:AbrB family looped-hinge helix DNA binding protein